MDKNEYLHTLKKTQLQIENFEKDLMKIFPFCKTTTLKNDIINMINVEERRNFDSEKERNEIFKEIIIIKRDVVKFKEKVKLCEKNKESLIQIQDMSENLGSKISAFKEKQMLKFDLIADEELELQTFIENFMEKMPQYEMKVSDNLAVKEKNSNNLYKIEENQEEFYYDDDDKPSVSSNFLDKNEQKLQYLKEEIENIERQIVQLGGKNCGWSKDDHNDFLKIRTKHKDQITKLAFLNACLSGIPLQTQEQIIEHIERFKQYLQLDHEKKSLVQEYKEIKEKQKKENKLKQIKIEENLQQVNKQKKVISEEDEKIRQEQIKQQIKEWKQKKFAVIEVEDDQKKKEEKERQYYKKQTMIRENEFKKQMVQEFKQLKEIEKTRLKEKEEYEKVQTNRLTSQEMERIKQKEQLLLEKKMALIDHKMQKRNHSENRLKQIMESQNNKYAYVESKINEETKAAQCQKRQKFDYKEESKKSANTFGGNLLGIGMRKAIPLWRQQS